MVVMCRPFRSGVSARGRGPGRRPRTRRASSSRGTVGVAGHRRACLDAGVEAGPARRHVAGRRPWRTGIAFDDPVRRDVLLAHLRARVGSRTRDGCQSNVTSVSPVARSRADGAAAVAQHRRLAGGAASRSPARRTARAAASSAPGRRRGRAAGRHAAVHGQGDRLGRRPCPRPVGVRHREADPMAGRDRVARRLHRDRTSTGSSTGIGTVRSWPSRRLRLSSPRATSVERPSGATSQTRTATSACGRSTLSRSTRLARTQQFDALGQRRRVPAQRRAVVGPLVEAEVRRAAVAAPDATVEPWSAARGSTGRLGAQRRASRQSRPFAQRARPRLDRRRRPRRVRDPAARRGGRRCRPAQPAPAGS